MPGESYDHMARACPTDPVRDKKLESWVKDSAFLGGAGKGEPTIVTPKQCKRHALDGHAPVKLIHQTKPASELRWSDTTSWPYQIDGPRSAQTRMRQRLKRSRRPHNDIHAVNSLSCSLDLYTMLSNQEHMQIYRFRHKDRY